MEPSFVGRFLRQTAPRSIVYAVLYALILASHEAGARPEWSNFQVYWYWIVQTALQFFLVIGAFAVILQMDRPGKPPWRAAVVGCIISFPIFFLAVTMLEVALTPAELRAMQGIDVLDQMTLRVFGEMDNHLFFTILVLTPQLFASDVAMFASNIAEEHAKLAAATRARPSAPAAAPGPAANLTGADEDLLETVRAELGADAVELDAVDEEPEPALPEPPPFYAHCQPKVSGAPHSVEAQEHYIKVTTENGSGMALYRFRDALRELSGHAGMQVHRSHWVADVAVDQVAGKRGSMSILLLDGRRAPVSRRHELEVEARYAPQEPDAEA